MIWRTLVIMIVIQSTSFASCEIKRGNFPAEFVFGTASASYQYEGAYKEDGRGLTIWDQFAHSFGGSKARRLHSFLEWGTPIRAAGDDDSNLLLESAQLRMFMGKVLDFSDGDVAVDQYHRYKEDVQLMSNMGMDAYRFSIAWSRIFPSGSGDINWAGVDHYNDLIDELLSKGIQPYVTLYHWDLPQALEDKYVGWINQQIIDDFANYAETCFWLFGDRVKHWITFNEPHTFSIQGYDVGLQAPGRCSVLLHVLCRAGNSATEPYIVAHNVLLAHAKVADIYRKKYKFRQNGALGISLDVIWFEPMSNSSEDVAATQRAQDFQLGWFMDPLFTGDYPSSMRSRVGSRLPQFTPDESALVKGSLDFVGVNHYTTYYAKENDTDIVEDLLHDALADSGAITLPFRNGKSIGDKASSIWLYIVPEGMRRLMNYIKNKYGNPPVIITENGMDDPNNVFIHRKEALKDKKRIKYHNDYLTSLLASITDDGCNVMGYFVWSLLDNWEWAAGFTSRFGLFYVDYKNNLTRYPKDSVGWFTKFLKSS